MTVREIFKKTLGEKRFQRLSKEWKDHIRGMDSLPKSVKPPRSAPPR